MENKPWTIKPWLWVALRQRKESLFGEQGGLAIELLPHMVQREVGVARPQLAMYAFMVTPLEGHFSLQSNVAWGALNTRKQTLFTYLSFCTERKCMKLRTERQVTMAPPP